MPAYDLIDMSEYIGGNPFSMRYPTMGIISSRGCPQDCSYCSIKHVWGRTWRGRNPQSVVDEIAYLQRTYNVHEFSFLDDSMSVDPKRLEGICQEIIKRKLGIKWTTPNGIAHWTLTKRLLSVMKASGCYRITFGIESGSPQVRRYIKKDWDLKQAKSLISHANRIGLWTITTNILGLPFETQKDASKTISYAIDCGTDFACFYTAIFHPKTRITRDQDSVLIRDVERLQRQAYREFILSRIPTAVFRLLSKIRSWEDFCYAFRLSKKGIRILLNTFRRKGHILYD